MSSVLGRLSLRQKIGGSPAHQCDCRHQRLFVEIKETVVMTCSQFCSHHDERCLSTFLLNPFHEIGAIFTAALLQGTGIFEAGALQRRQQTVQRHCIVLLTSSPP